MSKNKRVDMDTRPMEPIRTNYDYGESPFFGTPGGGEKSMGDWIKKHREKRKKNFKALLDGKFDVLRAATVFLQKVAFIKDAAPEDVLNTIPASDEVKKFILEQPKDHIGHYIGTLKKNPAVGIDELKNAVKLPKQREKSLGDIADESILKSDPHFYNTMHKNVLSWARILLRKLRHNDQKPDVATGDFLKADGAYKYPEYEKFKGFLLGTDIIENMYNAEFEDWYNYEDAQGTPPDLASLSLKQISDAVTTWHIEQANKGSNQEYQEGDSNIVYGPQWKNTEFNGWTIKKVTTQNDLEVEGNRMNHCVGSYCEQVKNSDVDIYSLRDPQNKPHVTMEVVPGTFMFMQIKGNSNSIPKQEYKNLLKEWFQTLPGAMVSTQYDTDDSVDFKKIEKEIDITNNASEIIQKLNYKKTDDYGLPINLSKSNLNIRALYSNIVYVLYLQYKNKYVPEMDKIANELVDLVYKHDFDVINVYSTLSDKQKDWHGFDNIDYKMFLPYLLSEIEDENQKQYNKDHPDYPVEPKEPFATDFPTYEEYLEAEKNYEINLEKFEDQQQNFSHIKYDLFPYKFNKKLHDIIVQKLETNPFPKIDALEGSNSRMENFLKYEKNS